MMIDAHIHLDHYDEIERNEILSSLDGHEVEALIAVSFDMESCQKNLALSLEDSRVKPAFGFHPEQELLSLETMNELFKWMESHVDETVAVGEVGLPYYKKGESNTILDYQPYIELLDRFIEFAVKHDKPIVLHAVYEDASIACDLLEKHGFNKAHFHWFKGDQVAHRMIHNGYYISITPDVFYEEEIQQLVQIYPLEQLMVETDGPWPFEGPFSGQITHPKMMKQSIEKIAELKDLSSEKVTQILHENTKRFYGI
nr:TatD family hydrolase [Lysinibacillus timonensis]